MRANRGRSLSLPLRFAAVSLATMLLAVPIQRAGADTKSDLVRARARLTQLEGQIQTQHARLRQLQRRTVVQHARLQALQAQLDRLVARIDAVQSRLAETEQAIAAVQSELRRARNEYLRLQGRLNLRARLAYEQGPTGSLALLLGSTTVGELSD